MRTNPPAKPRRGADFGAALVVRAVGADLDGGLPVGSVRAAITPGYIRSHTTTAHLDLPVPPHMHARKRACPSIGRPSHTRAMAGSPLKRQRKAGIRENAADSTALVVVQLSTHAPQHRAMLGPVTNLRRQLPTPDKIQRPRCPECNAVETSGRRTAPFFFFTHAGQYDHPGAATIGRSGPSPGLLEAPPGQAALLAAILARTASAR
jgi:hypothetical protein